MRSQIQRDKKYRAKLDGDIAKIRADADGNRQKAAFRGAVVGQVEIEQRVRSILNADGILPMFNHFYMDFGKRLGRIRKTHGGNIAQAEACIQYWKWSARGLPAATLDKIMAVMGFQPCVAPPPPCDWDWKRKLTFSGNVSATNLDDFPVLVHLTNANFDFNKARPLGQDIRFMDSDTCPPDGTPLDHEIEHWDKPGANAWVWVKVPRIDGGTVNDFIYMFYGNNAAPDAQNAAGVWSNGYMAVLHLRGNGTANLPDSLAAYNFTKLGIGQPANVVGKIDGAQLFDGVNDFTNNPTLLDVMPSAVVHSFWIKPTNGWSPGMPATEFIVQKRNAATDIHHVYFFNINGTLHLETRRAGVTVGVSSIKTNWLAQFYHISAHFGTGGLKIYVDGVLDNSNPSTLVMQNGTYRDYFLGSADGPNLWLDGTIDEYRISNVTRTTDWVHAQWKSQDETLITYGAEE